MRLSHTELGPFRSTFSQDIFKQKYAHPGCETWEALAWTLASEVCGKHLPRSSVEIIARLIAEMKFIPGGRYLYYAGREIKAYNNCYLLRAEADTREDWADLSWKSESCLMTGGGIGCDYTRYRASGLPLRRTGGTSSGPLPKMEMINEIGRRVMQGGSRRSAIYASLSAEHPDVWRFLRAKDWHQIKVPGTGLSLKDVKELDFNWPAPLDMTNVSVNYGDPWLAGYLGTGDPGELFIENTRQALRTAEPGFSFNFGSRANETLRNACTEVTSEDDSDVCNLGSLNLSRFDTLDEFDEAAVYASQFLVCGTLTAHLPYEKVYRVREKNRRLGLGIMGLHEWLLARGHRYRMAPELAQWLCVYERQSQRGADALCDHLGISRPVAYRAIAPTGTIGIMAGTTTGIEPIYAVAYKRRYLKGSKDWHYQYVVDSTAQLLIDRLGIESDKIETAVDLAADPERRVALQAGIQDYVDMAISSTINLPPWGSDLNNEDRVVPFARMIANYAHRLRGLTVYPSESRGGQPLTTVPYEEARDWQGTEFREHDSCLGGVCGL